MFLIIMISRTISIHTNMLFFTRRVGLDTPRLGTWRSKRVPPICRPRSKRSFESCSNAAVTADGEYVFPMECSNQLKNMMINMIIKVAINQS